MYNELVNLVNSGVSFEDLRAEIEKMEAAAKEAEAKRLEEEAKAEGARAIAESREAAVRGVICYLIDIDVLSNEDEAAAAHEMLEKAFREAESDLAHMRKMKINLAHLFGEGLNDIPKKPKVQVKTVTGQNADAILANFLRGLK